MPAPDRALAQLVACAFLTSLTLAGAAALLTADGLVAGTALSFWCVIAPVSLVDWALHSTAFGLWLLLALAIIGATRVLGRERAVTAELRAAARQARLRQLPESVAHAAALLGVDGLLDVVDAPRPFAFVYGCRRPRICLSTGLISRLSDDELAAVLYHERWHQRRRDPARLLMVRTVAASFAFVPGVHRLAEQHAVAMELAADRHATTAMGSKRWLASALAKVATHDPPSAIVGFAGLAEARIAALAGDPLPARGRLDRTLAGLFVAKIAVVALLLGQGGLGPLRGLWPHPIC